MKEMSPGLLAIAAEMRAAGASWERIGEQVGRHPDNCRHWPMRYPATWHQLYRDAEIRHIATGGSEGLAALRLLLRKGSERAQLAAAGILYRARLAERISELAPLPSAEEQMAIEQPHLADQEEQPCLAEKPTRALKKARCKGLDGAAGETAAEKLGAKVAKTGQVPAEKESTPAEGEAC